MDKGGVILDPELAIINKAISGGMNELRLTGINHLYFRRYPHIWRWIESFFDKRKKTPEIATVTEQFPDLLILPTPEPVEYYVGRLLDSIKRAEYVEYVDKLNSALKVRDMDAARSLTVGLYSSVAFNSAETGDLVGSETLGKTMSLIKGAEKSFQSAITTGLTAANEEIGGWYPGEFCAYIGPPYSGKSWVMINNAVSCVKAGQRVVLASGEMPPEQVWMRFLSLYFNLPAKRVRQGRLTDTEKRDLRRLLKETTMPGEIYVPRLFDVSGTDLLKRKIYQYGPDVVFVDSWYSLVDTRSRYARWEELANLASDFKKMALDMRIPIVITHQMGRQGAERQRGAKLSDIAGSFDIIGWLDVCAVVVLNDELRKTREMGLIFRKVRDLDPFSFTVRFNVNSGEPMETQKETWVLEEVGKSSPVGMSEEDLDQLARSSYL